MTGGTVTREQLIGYAREYLYVIRQAPADYRPRPGVVSRADRT